VTTYKDIHKWEPWIKILKASKVTKLAMQKWMAVVASARELNVLKGIKSTTKELNLLSGFQGEVMSKNDIEVAPMISGRAFTATLYVSPDGKNSDGSSWARAYTTIQAALNAASTDTNDCTLIMIAPHPTYYDINTTGDPTWTGNYELVGSHRIWSAIRNEHASADSIFKFTGKVGLKDLALFQTTDVDGVIFTNSGYRIRHCGFNAESATGASTSIHIDGSGGNIRGGTIEDVEVKGHVTHTTGLYMNNAKINTTKEMNFHTCLTAIQVLHADSDGNYFNDIEIGGCALGLDLDAGNGQHFEHINFHNNTANIDDEVGDHYWADIHGQFAIEVTPDNFTGIAVDTGDGADTWSALATVYTNASGSPFRVVGVHLAPGSSEWYRLQFTADDGTTYYDDLQFDANKREGSAAPSGTEYIFNEGTVIKARSKSESGGVDGLDVWLEVQEV